MIGKYKLVFVDNLGEMDNTPEVVIFNCVNPLMAVRAYVEAIIADDKNILNVKVFPADVEPKPLIEVGKSMVATGIKPNEKFVTPDSSFITKVTWRGTDSSVGVHFARGGYIIYQSDYEMFDAFRAWVALGNSAGTFYNQNVKGLEVIGTK